MNFDLSTIFGGTLSLYGDYRLASPMWLVVLAIIGLIVWLRSRRRVPVLVVPFSASWYRPSLGSSSRVPQIFALCGLVLLIVALARPQKVEDKREVKAQGYDLMLAIDISSSMLAEDYEKNGEPLNRLQAIKPVIKAFINDRPNDRIGIVVFSGVSYTLAPLTFDHEWLARQTEQIKIGLIPDGTAIGDGLGVALSRLEQAKHEEGARRKGAFIILLTDGANNRGVLTPNQAADIAKARSIPVYTIGAGKNGYVPYPLIDRRTGQRVDTTRIQSDLDEGALRAIANTTGGRYFKADDVRTIEHAFKAIDESQKIEFQAKSYLLTTELFPWPGAVGLGLFFIGVLSSRRFGTSLTRRPSSVVPSATRASAP